MFSLHNLCTASCLPWVMSCVCTASCLPRVMSCVCTASCLPRVMSCVCTASCLPWVMSRVCTASCLPWVMSRVCTASCSRRPLRRVCTVPIVIFCFTLVQATALCKHHHYVVRHLRAVSCLRRPLRRVQEPHALYVMIALGHVSFLHWVMCHLCTGSCVISALGHVSSLHWVMFAQATASCLRAARAPTENCPCATRTLVCSTAMSTGALCRQGCAICRRPAMRAACLGRRCSSALPGLGCVDCRLRAQPPTICTLAALVCVRLRPFFIGVLSCLACVGRLQLCFVSVCTFPALCNIHVLMPAPRAVSCAPVTPCSGALSGLTRVRRFQQDDAHIFCRQDQVCMC